MAELILSPTADQILGSLRSVAVKEIALSWWVTPELLRLEETISAIKAVLLDAEEKQVNSNQVRNWLHRLGGALEEADILMDELNTEALLRKVMDGSEMAKQVLTFFSAPAKLPFGRPMRLRIREIRKKLDVISRDKNFPLEVRHEVNKVIPRGGRDTQSFVRQEEVVGRDEDREKIVKLLLDPGELEENASVIPIVGMGGLGKTTLAQSAFNAEAVQQHFEPKIWVCVSSNLDLMLIAQQIIKSATNGNNLEGIDTLDQLQKELRKVLNGKRYLLVLDDVWEEKEEKWLMLKYLLLSGSQRSRTIVTTPSQRVAEITGSVQPYQLGILDEEKSWSLFEKMVFKQKEGERNLEAVGIGRKIMQHCGGVPFTIRVVGSMLSFKNSKSEWLSFYKGFSRMPNKTKTDILLMLKLSYDHLPSRLKRCFAYCSLFPKDYRIEVQKLVKLWRAQGLLKSQNSRDDQCLADMGYEYFMALLERSFFQEVEIDGWGTVKTCKMHDLMHDLAVKVAGETCATASLNSGGKIDECTRHISFDYNIDSLKRISTLLIEASNIQTFILLAQDVYKWHEECEQSTLDAIISSLKLIRILDLNNLGIKILPESIGRCKHLRYLDLSGNSEIKMLPNSITDLPNLQTLRLNDCSELEELPQDMKKLVSLRHLEIDGCDELTRMPLGLSQLTKLQTLSKYILIHESNSSIKRQGGELKELMGLNKISGKLEILNLSHGNDVAREYGFANLKEKQYLRSLELKWIDDDVIGIEAFDGYEMALEALQPHPNIQELHLQYFGGVHISSWLSSLTNLVNLSLDSCEKCQHLVALSQFHRLKKLHLRELPCLEYIDDEEDWLLSSETRTVILPSLQELILFGLPNLEGWWREVVSGELLPCFPLSLSKLKIVNCPQLSCMPLYPHLKSLVLSRTGLKPFHQTIESCYKGIGIPTSNNSNSTSFLSPLSKLEYLRLDGIEEDLQCLPDWFKGLSCLKSLDIRGCWKLRDLSWGIQHLTSLERLDIYNCSELEEMNSGSGRLLRFLRLRGLPKLASLPGSIQHLTSLQHLWVSDCNSLETIPECIGNLISLEKLEVHNCPELKSLPQGIRGLTSLESLWLRHCPKLKSLPEGISGLTSLHNLELENCPKLISLPEGIRSLTCLKSLEIWECPILLKRCQREIGEDWPKIAHIQHLNFYPDPNHKEEDNDERRSRML